MPDKPLDVSDMPPLSREMHSDLRSLENRLMRDLSSCCANYNLIDPAAAVEYARTYAAEFFDLYYDFYSMEGGLEHHSLRKPASKQFAFQRVLHCLNNHSAISRYFESDRKRIDGIKRTISDYADRKHPEVLMARPSSRPQVFAPIQSVSPLELLISTAQAAEKMAATPTRIPRSIQSHSAARKVEDHIRKKGITQTAFAGAVRADEKTLRRFRNSGKVDKSVAQRIAEAMNISLDDLLS